MSHLRSHVLTLALTGLLASASAAIALTPAAHALTGAAATGGASAPTTTYAPSSATPLPRTGAAPTATTPAIKPFQSTSAAPAPVQPSAHHAGKLSTEAIAAAALAALLALGCIAWGVARFASFEPHWTQSLRHAAAEAGFRASATWAEFTDWVRLGH
ncbi:MAG TPA: hypothetical protein VES97_06185 [Solirubrobacteraceae bacterium]|nr:hypothetical protein [Solirubrobacteraceae bacterium]